MNDKEIKKGLLVWFVWALGTTIAGFAFGISAGFWIGLILFIFCVAWYSEKK